MEASCQSDGTPQHYRGVSDQSDSRPQHSEDGHGQAENTPQHYGSGHDQSDNTPQYSEVQPDPEPSSSLIENLVRGYYAPQDNLLKGYLKGQMIERNNKKKTTAVTIEWKQDSVFGIGGDRSQDYNVCEYKLAEWEIPVYVQSGWSADDKLLVDDRLQFGINRDGIVFLVLHDKEQKPYSHRFIMIENSFREKIENTFKDMFGVDIDLMWMKGRPLENF